jgi:hypothetical protein
MAQKIYEIRFYSQKQVFDRGGNLMACSICQLVGIQIVFDEDCAAKIVEAVNHKGEFTASYGELI